MLPKGELFLTSSDQYRMTVVRKNRNLTAEQRANGVKRHEPLGYGLTGEQCGYILRGSVSVRHAAQRLREHLVDGKPFEITPGQGVLPDNFDAILRERVASEVARNKAEITAEERKQIEDAAIARMLKFMAEKEERAKQRQEGFKTKPPHVGKQTEAELRRTRHAIFAEQAKILYENGHEFWKDWADIRWSGGTIRKLSVDWNKHKANEAAKQIVQGDAMPTVGDMPEHAIARAAAEKR